MSILVDLAKENGILPNPDISMKEARKLADRMGELLAQKADPNVAKTIRRQSKIFDQVYAYKKHVDRQVADPEAYRRNVRLLNNPPEGVKFTAQDAFNIMHNDFDEGYTFAHQRAVGKKPHVERFACDIDVASPEFPTVYQNLCKFIVKHKGSFKVPFLNSAGRSDTLNCYVPEKITPEVASEFYHIVKPVLNETYDGKLDGVHIYENGQPIKGIKIGPEYANLKARRYDKAHRIPGEPAVERAQKVLDEMCELKFGKNQIGIGSFTFSRTYENFYKNMSLGERMAYIDSADFFYYMMGKEGQSPVKLLNNDLTATYRAEPLDIGGIKPAIVKDMTNEGGGKPEANAEKAGDTAKAVKNEVNPELKALNEAQTAQRNAQAAYDTAAKGRETAYKALMENPKTKRLFDNLKGARKEMESVAKDIQFAHEQATNLAQTMRDMPEYVAWEKAQTEQTVANVQLRQAQTAYENAVKALANTPERLQAQQANEAAFERFQSLNSKMRKAKEAYEQAPEALKSEAKASYEEAQQARNVAREEYSRTAQSLKDVEAKARKSPLGKAQREALSAQQKAYAQLEAAKVDVFVTERKLKATPDGKAILEAKSKLDKAMKMRQEIVNKEIGLINELEATSEGNAYKTAQLEFLKTTKELNEATARTVQAQTAYEATVKPAKATETTAELKTEAAKAAETTAELKAEAAKAAETTAELKAEAAKTAETTAELKAEAVKTGETTAELKTEPAKAAETTAELNAEAAKAAETTAELKTEAAKTAETTSELNAEAAKAAETTAELNAEAAKAAETATPKSSAKSTSSPRSASKSGAPKAASTGALAASSASASKSATAAKALGSGLAVVGAISEGVNATHAFEEGRIAAGVVDSAISGGFAAGAASVVTKGATAAALGTAGAVAGSVMFGRDAVISAQEGRYVDATFNAAGFGGLTYSTVAGLMGSSVPLGTAVAAAPVAATVAAVGTSAAIGWSLGRLASDLVIDPGRTYAMNYEDAKKLLAERGSMADPYVAGFVDLFNENFDEISAGWSMGAQWNRLFTTQKGRKQDIVEGISQNPQAAYQRGVNGLGGVKGLGANAFLIYEGIKAGAKPRAFDDLERGYTTVHDLKSAVKSDFSQVFSMNTGMNDGVNEAAQNATAAFLLQNGAGFSADDLANAMRSNYEMPACTLLTSVVKTDGAVRQLYTQDDSFNIHYTPPEKDERFLLPQELKTADNMNALMRAAMTARSVTPIKMSAVQQAFNNEGAFKIAEDVVVENITNTDKYLSEDIEDKKQAKEGVLTALCGNEESGYRFHAWEMTPKVVASVSHLDETRQGAFITYAKEQGLKNMSSEMQAALEALSPKDFEPKPEEKPMSEKISWTVKKEVAGPVAHVYKTQVAYDRAHARLNGKVYRNVRQRPRYKSKDREQMLANMRVMEERGLLPKGANGKSNVEVYLYKIQQVNLLSYDASQVVVDGKKTSFGAYVSDGGKNPSTRSIEKLLKKPALTEEEQHSIAATILKTEELVDDFGRMLMQVYKGNNYSYAPNGEKNFDVVQTTQTVLETHEEIITGTQAERTSLIEKMAQNGIQVTRTPLNEEEKQADKTTDSDKVAPDKTADMEQSSDKGADGANAADGAQDADKEAENVQNGAQCARVLSVSAVSVNNTEEKDSLNTVKER